jgi:hypothetical protein
MAPVAKLYRASPSVGPVGAALWIPGASAEASLPTAGRHTTSKRREIWLPGKRRASRSKR